MIPAILIMLCCRLMMISLANKLCHVPIINCRMNISSTAVSAGLLPSFIFAKTINVLAKVTRDRNRNFSLKKKLHTGIPRIPRFSMSDVMRRICHFVCQWLVFLDCDFVASGLHSIDYCACVEMPWHKCPLHGRQYLKINSSKIVITTWVFLIILFIIRNLILKRG